MWSTTWKTPHGQENDQGEGIGCAWGLKRFWNELLSPRTPATVWWTEEKIQAETVCAALFKNRECQHLLIAVWALIFLWTYTAIGEDDSVTDKPPRPIGIISTTLKSTRTFMLFMYPVKATAYRWTFKFRWWSGGASAYYYKWWVHALGLRKSLMQGIHRLQQGKGFNTTSAKTGIFGC